MMQETYAQTYAQTVTRREKLIHSLNAKYGRKIPCKCTRDSCENEDCLADHCVSRQMYERVDYWNETGISFCGCTDEEPCPEHCPHCSSDGHYHEECDNHGFTRPEEPCCYDCKCKSKSSNPLRAAAIVIQRAWREARINPYCTIGCNKVNRDYDELFM